MNRKFVIFTNAILFLMIATNLWSVTFNWFVNDIDMSANPNLQTALLYIICGFLFNQYGAEKNPNDICKED